MKRIILFGVFIFSTANLFCQSLTNEQIERDLHLSYQKILLDKFNSDTDSLDMTEKDCKIFRDKLKQYTSFYPLTITYQFDSLQKENIDIVTSKDQLFRIYSWDTWTGGTMHTFENIYQYKSNDKVYSIANFDTSDHNYYVPFYSHIYTLNANKKTYYLGIFNGIYSTKDASQSIKIFTIENNQLNDTIKLIKANNRIINTIDVYFDFFSVVDRPERPLQLIKYDSDKKIIFIPIVYKNGTVTNKYILYKFTGQYFEKMETKNK